MTEFNITPKEAFVFLIKAVVILFALHILGVMIYFNSDNQDVVDFALLLDFDIEANIPTLFSSVIILISSILFYLIAFIEKNEGGSSRLYWIGLSFIFLFLSLDEGCKIHENLGDLVENYMEASGLVYFPWVIPYSILTIIFVLIYIRFLTRLPRKTAKLFIISGVLYVSGAVFLDMLGGKEAEANGVNTMLYTLLYTIEELFEMIAIVILIYTLLEYMENRFGYIGIRKREQLSSTENQQK